MSHLEAGAEGGVGAEAGCEAGPDLDADDDDGSGTAFGSVAAAAAASSEELLLLLPPILAPAAFDLPPRGIVSWRTSERSSICEF